LSKQEGGFIIRDLHRQNMCLLLNFVHKLHQPESLPWKDWFRLHSPTDLGDTSSTASFLEKIVAECLPLYRSITRCSVVSGTSTAFWKDKWRPGGSFADQFPALFSHCTRPNATVAVVLASGLSLQPRMSSAAARELAIVNQVIDATSLRDGHDIRSLDTSSAPPFSSRAAYRLLSPALPVDTSACIAWGSRLPAKLKIFAYLADIDRLSTRANLFFKNCAPSAICAACPTEETGRHIFFDCTLASGVWARLGVDIPADRFSFWDLAQPRDFPVDVWRVGMAVLLWSLWKARNDLVFNNRNCTAQLVIRRACEDLAVWRWRFKEEDRLPLDSLRSFFLSCNM
jgi:hypothetical protein